MLVEISPKTPAIFYHEDVFDHSDIYQIGHVDYLRNLYRFAKVQLSMQDKRRRFCNFPRKRSCLVFLKPILYQIYEVIILCDLRNIFHGYYWFIVPDLHPSDAVYTLNPSFKSMIAKVILMVQSKPIVNKQLSYVSYSVVWNRDNRRWWHDTYCKSPSCGCSYVVSCFYRNINFDQRKL